MDPVKIDATSTLEWRPDPGTIRPPSQGSELHHRPADDVVASQEVQIFVDLLKADGLDGMLDLAFSGERHDLAQVRVIAPERPMKGLLARHARKERDVDAIADEADIGVVTADRQQRKSQLHHLWRAHAIDDRIELVLSRGLLQLLADIASSLALDLDDVVGAIFLRDRKFVRIARERDDGRAGAEQLGILDRVSAEAADAKHADDPIGPESAGIADLLDATIGG